MTTVKRTPNWYRRCGKRVVDVIIATLALVAAMPFLLVLSLLVRAFIGSPVFFRQQRPGLHGRPFTIVKFRTMIESRGPDGELLPDKLRLTSFGRLLRSSSLDEVPELINVLRGEMSLVGPRPLLMQYLSRYTADQMRRHEVPPGLTGWAQLAGRNAIGWRDRLRLDVWYVDHCSLLLDLKIMVRTMKKVIAREGITAEGHATAPEFTGVEE
jgi:sugar transferase EpsL